jgi:hypothetical protein
MTDFLTRLAERTLGLTPRVQPLLASRYAPGPAVPDFPDTFSEEQALAPTRPADPTRAPTPRSRADALSTLESVSPRGVPETHATSGATEAAATTSLNSQQTAGLDAQEPVPPRAVSKTHNSARTTGLAVSSAESDASPSAESWRGRPSQPVRAPSPASPDRRGETASAHPLLAPAAPNAMVQANPSARHHEEPHAAPRLLSPVPQVHGEATNGGKGVFDRPVVERAARRADVVRPQLASIAGHAEPNPSANESGPPVIRVSIGRIEVRAILPPTPTAERPAPTRASPVLSLDQYLKQRNEGQR